MPPRILPIKSSSDYVVKFNNKQNINAFMSNWFVLTQIFMFCLSYRPEAEFIRSIVHKIFSELISDKRSNVYEDGLVGMGSRVEEMNSYLDLDSKDVRFIGRDEGNGQDNSCTSCF